MQTVWRLGHPEAPCAFPPRHLCGWHNRFDDPKRRYRTLYCAERSITCLRELLADLRPNSKAVADFEEVFSDLPEFSLPLAGVVSTEWRRSHVLVKAQIHLQMGDLSDIEQEEILRHLQREHAALLKTLGIETLKISDVRSHQRVVTQRFSRSLYEQGHAGIAFRSRLDNQPCFALFEERASLSALASPIPLSEDWLELVQVCGDYSLILRPV